MLREFVVAASLYLAACAGLAPSRSDVVGVWDAEGDGRIEMHADGQVEVVGVKLKYLLGESKRAETVTTRGALGGSPEKPHGVPEQTGGRSKLILRGFRENQLES